jgi:hypothetical protein
MVKSSSVLFTSTFFPAFKYSQRRTQALHHQRIGKLLALLELLVRHYIIVTI